MKKYLLLSIIVLITAAFLASCNDKTDTPTTGVQTYDPTIVPPKPVTEEVLSFENGLEYVVDSDISCHIVGIGSFKGDTLKIPGEDSDGRIVSYIKDYAFKNCTFIKTLVLEEGVVEINGGAFQGCTNLTSVTFPESLRVIDTFAFYGCSSLKYVYINANISKIGQNAFALCTKLENIEVDEESKAYRSVYGILYSSDLKTLDTYPCGKTDANITLPAGVERINNAAFEENQYIVSVKTPAGFTEIDDHAFRNCPNIEAVYLADTLQRIGVGAFYNCKKLDNVYFAGSEEMWKESDDDGDVYVKLANTWKSGAGKCNITYNYSYKY